MMRDKVVPLRSPSPELDEEAESSIRSIVIQDNFDSSVARRGFGRDISESGHKLLSQKTTALMPLLARFKREKQ